MTALIAAPEPAARRAVIALHARLAARGREVPLRLWDGTVLGAEADFRLVLRDPWSLRAMLVPPDDLTAAEAFVAGEVDVEGSMVAGLRALRGLVSGLGWAEQAHLGAAIARLPRPPADARRGRARLGGRTHSRSRDAAAVSHHYDVGNEFYRLFLDRRMVYSCGYLAEADRDRPVADRDVLDRAQRRKLELVCRKLALREGDVLLDVGCGWGSLALHAAEYHGVRIVGVTPSEQQAGLARERVAEAGLTDRVEIRCQDYREVTERFDAVASIGMVEHVGADQLPAYLAHLRERLVDGGRLLNHGITTGRRNVIRDLAEARDDGFIGRYVFPDGALVPAHVMIDLVERSGFELRDVEQLRPHYARTLQAWTANLEAAGSEATRVAGERVARVWRAYLAGSAISFEVGDLGVIQILATRGDASLPFDRDHLANLPDG